MKKISIATILTLIGWLGTTAYVSSSLKGDVERYIAKINKLYEPQGLIYKAEVESRFFTSELDVTLDIKEEKLGKAIVGMYGKVLKLPLHVHYHVEHGPIFYGNGFGMGWAKFTSFTKVSKILREPASNDFLSVVPEDITISLTELFCFDQKIKIDIHSNAVHLTNKEEKIDISPLKGHGVIDSQTLLGKLDVALPKIVIEGNGKSVSVNDTTIHVDMKDIYADRYFLGDIVMQISEFTLENERLPEAIKMDARVDISTQRENDNYLGLSVDIMLNQKGLAQLQPNRAQLPQKIGFNFAFEGISPEAMKKFEQINQKQIEISNMVYALMKEQDQSKRDAMQMAMFNTQIEMMQDIAETFKVLFVKERTKVKLGGNMMTKDGAKSNIKLTAGYTGKRLQGSLDEIVRYLQKKPLEYLALDIDMDFNEKHIALNPSPQERQQVKTAMDMSVAQGTLDFKNGIYSIKLEYRPKTLKINGQDKSQEILPLLEMILTQGGKGQPSQPQY